MCIIYLVEADKRFRHNSKKLTNPFLMNGTLDRSPLPEEAKLLIDYTSTQCYLICGHIFIVDALPMMIIIDESVDWAVKT